MRTQDCYHNIINLMYRVTVYADRVSLHRCIFIVNRVTTQRNTQITNQHVEANILSDIGYTSIMQMYR